MGLDMYLTRRTAVDGGRLAEIVKAGTTDDKQLTLEGFDTADTAGEPQTMGVEWSRVESVTESIATWRGCWWLLDWLNHSIGGIESSRDYPTSRDTLAELQAVITSVLDDHDKASELLATIDDLDEDYDDYYFEELDETLQILNGILSRPEAEDSNSDYLFHAWW